MEAKDSFGCGGHIGHFTNPDRNSVYFKGDFMSVKAAPHPGVIKFQGFDLPPYLYFQRESDRNFTVFGAWFSLLYESAKKLNYTLVGLAPGRTESESRRQLFSFRPDVILAPFVAQTDMIMEFMAMGYIEPSRLAYITELDHILSAKNYRIWLLW